MKPRIAGNPATVRTLVLAAAFALLAAPPSAAEPPKPKDAKDRPTNRLARESSPYLLMHAHNPVNWHPWGFEAFARAKKEGKLVFLSIGYSSCYWCHVMERESFDNPAVAKLLNEWFVCIKVDREERPDIDNIYMTSLHAFGQRGGWPLSMFLTADGKPIVGGTYWPPDDRVVEGEKSIGFKSVLKKMHDLHAESPKELEAQADKVAGLTIEALAGTVRGMPLLELNRSLVAGSVQAITDEFDKVHGGFGKGTKFPTPPYLNLLLREAARTRSAESMEMLTLTLDRIAMGGIYDQLGGGFHRYSTERTWTIPHFEKMLYDNAQLVEIYARAYRLTEKPLYRRVVQETLEFVAREMTAADGGFYSALDAETDGEEGRFYVWTSQEIDDAVGKKEDADLIKKVYGAGGANNFESKYHILTLAKPLAETARELNLTETELQARLTPLRRKLFEARSHRPRVFLDTKVLTAWNGQMIAGYAVAGQSLKDPKYVEVAVRAATFVLENLKTKEGRLLRTYAKHPGKTGRGRLNAYLDDYAFLADGLLCLHDATADKRWLGEAKSLTDTMVQFHGDKDRGGFYYTSEDHEKLFARAKDQYDGAQPSGNSIAARNLVRLWLKTGDARYRALAEKSFKAFSAALKTNPAGLTAMADALALYLDAQEAQNELPKKDPPGKGAGAKKSDTVVKITATADKPDAAGKQTLSLTIAIDKPWHIYTNPLPQDFPGIPTAITVSAAMKPESVKVDFPPGKVVKDPVLGDYHIYEGAVTIKAAVQRARGDASPLEVSVRIQACSDKQCLLPGVVTLKVP